MVVVGWGLKRSPVTLALGAYTSFICYASCSSIQMSSCTVDSNLVKLWFSGPGHGHSRGLILMETKKKFKTFLLTTIRGCINSYYFVLFWTVYIFPWPNRGKRFTILEPQLYMGIVTQECIGPWIVLRQISGISVLWSSNVYK